MNTELSIFREFDIEKFRTLRRRAFLWIAMKEQESFETKRSNYMPPADFAIDIDDWVCKNYPESAGIWEEFQDAVLADGFEDFVVWKVNVMVLRVAGGLSEQAALQWVSFFMKEFA